VLDRLALSGVGVVSAQVLADFFNTVTRKLTAPLTVSQAIQRVENYLQSWTVLDTTGLVVLEAARGVREHSFNFWDAQIWAVARLNQIAVVFSEDFSPGRVMEEVRLPLFRKFLSKRMGRMRRVFSLWKSIIRCIFRFSLVDSPNLW